MVMQRTNLIKQRQRELLCPCFHLCYKGFDNQIIVLVESMIRLLYSIYFIFLQAVCSFNTCISLLFNFAYKNTLFILNRQRF